PALLLPGEILVVPAPPRVDEPARRIGLEHLVVRPERRAIGGPAPHPGADDGQRCVRPRAEEELGDHLRIGDRLPDPLRRGFDVHLIDLSGLGLGRHHHASFSSSSFSSKIAATRASVYLPIHRSWISRIGTGFRKWSLCLPRRRDTTSPASSRTRRCFMTPKRVISSSETSS